MKKEKNKTIMVIEDDPDIAELLELVLVNERYRVLVFIESAMTLKVIKKEKPDLIIMDLWMPGIDGVTLTKKFKSDKSTKNIPIVLVSARNSLEKISKQSGADTFISKPFDIKDLLSVVRKYLK